MKLKVRRKNFSSWSWCFCQWGRKRKWYYAMDAAFIVSNSDSSFWFYVSETFAFSHQHQHGSAYPEVDLCSMELLVVGLVEAYWRAIQTGQGVADPTAVRFVKSDQKGMLRKEYIPMEYTHSLNGIVRDREAQIEEWKEIFLQHTPRSGGSAAA